MTKGNANEDNDSLSNEIGDIGIWTICPECMSKEVWQVSCTFQNVKMKSDKKVGGRLLSNSFIVGSLCKQCGFVELTQEAKQLGFDKLDWNLMRNETQ
jgi:hypothetical protein